MSFLLLFSRPFEGTFVEGDGNEVAENAGFGFDFSRFDFGLEGSD